MFAQSNHSSRLDGFTIVELLVVIAVIGILAAITIVSYSSILGRAKIASIQSDLTNASKQLSLFQITNPISDFPTTIDCAIADSNTNKCIKSSNGSTYTYIPYNAANPKTFALTATNGTLFYKITSNMPPTATLNPIDWLTIGNQTWAKANLNVGTMVTGVTNQTNNSILEKYCISDLEANCTTSGGLYQWDEAMQYVTTSGVQGICPAGSHIPSDNDWKILEMQLGMSQVEVDTAVYRGTDQGTQLKSGGNSGLNLPLPGYRYTNGLFYNLSSSAYLWSSSESSPLAWARSLNLSNATISRGANDKGDGFSVRCLEN